MTDFFISYTHADVKWAEWIGYILEEEGFTTVIQAWDFRPGSNFVLEMQHAAAAATRTIMVLSPDYLKSQFASPEWAAAFAQDPQGLERLLVPVQVRDCEPKGLLSSIVQIRIGGLEEPDARDRLVAGVNAKRAKPSSRPAFPGAVPTATPKAFPGPVPGTPSARKASSGLIPSLQRSPTDMDKRRFVKHGFETIRRLFETNLQTVAQEEGRIETDFQLQTATDFRAELFLDGKSKSICRIWQGGMHSDNNICFSEGRNTSDNSCNEIIALSQENDLHFQALMAMGSFRHEQSFDLKKLKAEDAAEYLWQRFVSPLGR